MRNRQPLNQAEKEQIYQGKLGGQTLAEIATEVGCWPVCARKWWRVGRDEGLEGLNKARRGRGDRGLLSQFRPEVASAALAYKQGHHGWGADRVLVELKETADLRGLALPKRSRLAAFFKGRCPECVAAYKVHPPTPRRAPDVTGVHEMWQLDSQEGLALHDGDKATICNIRDPVGAAMIASQSFSVKTELHWRKLTWQEVREVLRTAFSEWQTLPDGLQTDNELGLAGGPNDPYPGHLTLWLVGLGIKHRFIRPGCPTDQPQIERNHRTLDNLALDDQALLDQAHLQQALNRERHGYNRLFPSHASDCAGRPPLVAYHELLLPRRFYQPDLELILFDLQRVYDYLATFTFTRTVSPSAQVGQKLVRTHHLKTVLVQFDPQQKVWVFLTETGEELLRRPPIGLDVSTLTGLDPASLQPCQPIQLSFPAFVA